jgi:FkbM family methyltransferase
MKFISQKGQDEWIIDNIFNYKKNGYFVDLAAADGIRINNTYLLEKDLEWNGICIEPNPQFFNKLKQNRKCHLTDIVIDKYNDKEVEFRIDNGELGGIVDEDTDNNYTIRGKELKTAKIVKLKTKTLDFILDHFQAPKVIDYLSLDVEGAEERILSNFPFDKYTFLTMTIERPTPELEKILFDNNYVFVRKSGINRNTMDTYYVHKTIGNFNEIVKEDYSPTPKKKW